MLKNILRRISIKGVLAGAVVGYIALMAAGIPLVVLAFSKTDIATTTSAEQTTKMVIAFIYGNPFVYSALVLESIIANIIAGCIAARVAKHNELLNGLIAVLPVLFITAFCGGADNDPTPMWEAVLLFVTTPFFGLLGGALCIAWRQNKIPANLPVTRCDDQIPTLNDSVTSSKKFLEDILDNVFSGFKALFFCRIPSNNWHTSIPVLSTLFGLILLISAVAEYFEKGIGSTLYIWDIPRLLAVPMIIMAAALPYYLMRRPQPNNLILPTILTSLLVTYYTLVVPVPWIFGNLGWLKNVPHYILHICYFSIHAWLVAAFIVSTRQHLAPIQRGGTALVIYAVIMTLLLYIFPPRGIWHAPKSHENPTLSSEDSKRQDLLLSGDIIQLEPKIFNDAIAALKRSSPNHSDMYFVGVAPYSYQDIFMKEVLTIEDLFDKNFNTKGRSLLLINNVHTADTIPLATKANIKQALKDVGQHMDKRKDILVLYLTSHGSKENGLAMGLNPFYKMGNLEPENLKSMLDDSGIVWRIVIISGCHSGVFIPALQDDNTLVMTASDADHTSFGCSEEGEMTDFPKALIVDHLMKTHDFIDSFNLAKKDIAEEERNADRAHSNPQIYIGKKMVQELGKLDGYQKK